MKKEEKYLQYAAILSGKIAELFDEDSESDYRIDKEELEDDDNLTHFFHALATIMPCHMFNKITGNDKDVLQFNHVANTLCFQFSKKENEE